MSKTKKLPPYTADPACKARWSHFSGNVCRTCKGMA